MTLFGRLISDRIADKLNNILRPVDPEIGSFIKYIQDQRKILCIGEYDFTVNADTLTFVDADVTVSGDTITESAHGLKTGDAVVLTTTGTLPTGLSADTAYYVIYVTASKFKLATSRANAFAGTAINITAAAGGGTHTLKKNVFGEINLLTQGYKIPDKAIVTRTFYKVYTTFTSRDDSATLALQLNGANDIVTATAISAGGNVWDAGGPVAGVQDNAIANFLTLTADRELIMKVEVQPISAGKIKLFAEIVDVEA